MSNNILLLSKAQKELFKRIKSGEVEFNLKFSTSSEKSGMPVATLWQAWKQFCINNDIELSLSINGDEYCRHKVKRSETKQRGNENDGNSDTLH